LLAQQGQASEALQVVDDIAQHLGILKLDETSSVGSSGSHLPDVSTITNTNESNSNVIFEDTSTQILHDIATNQSSSSGSLTLNNILTCYKLLKRSDKIQSFYQSAWNKCIALNNKTLAKQFGLGLFGSLLRSRDWTTARSHTLNLFRTYNETRYFMWHLVTVVLSVPTDASLHTLSQREIATLQVAEGLFTKNLLTPGKVTTQQEILWYLKLLQRLGRYQQALELLQRDSVSKFFPISSQRETLYAQILAEYAISTSTTSTKEDSVQRVTLLRDSIAAYTKLLRTVDADEWSYYRTLFTLARTLNTSEVWTQLHTLFSELADSHKSKYTNSFSLFFLSLTHFILSLISSILSLFHFKTFLSLLFQFLNFCFVTFYVWFLKFSFLFFVYIFSFY
jgi:tetratricopeptide (TPR) repeat protein